MNVKNIRLLNQQLAAPLFADVHDLVEWFGMMQAQDYQMMRWAVAMRLKRPSVSALADAFAEGKVVRSHLFRCTWQLVAGEDLRWMLRLCADKNRRAINGFLAAYGRQIDEPSYRRALDVFADVLQGRGSMPKSELLQRCAERGLTDDAHTMSIYLRRAEIDGLICSGDLHPRQNTYALLEERLPSTPSLADDEAVALLARKYFRSHAPATLDDFVWWSNLPRSVCRQALDALRGELTEEHWQGTTFYLHEQSRTRGCRASLHLLPSYDEYLIGYKSRHLVLDDAFRSKAFSNNGLFHPVVLRQGRVVGNWHPRRSAADFFLPEYEEDVTTALERYHAIMSNTIHQKSKGK